jgi:hypothetical protein
VQIPSSCENEQGAPQRCVQLVLADLDFLPRDVGEDDEPYVVSRLRTRLRSSRA